jgi:hypothetical protein
MAGGVFWFRSTLLSPARAVPPQAEARAEPAAPQPNGTPEPTPSEWASRVVAYLYDNQPVSREELGEYLIVRHGARKLEPLVRQRIIEHACRQQDIQVTATDVEAALAEDIQGLNVNRETFVRALLAKYKKNLYEWREDVIRPRLMMTRLCQGHVHVTEQDVLNAFESTHGEKVACRIIIWKPDEVEKAKAAYARLRDGPEEFEREAKAQFLPGLAASGGKIRPFGRHTMGETVETEAFKLREGELSTLIESPDGPFVLRCEKRFPADTTRSLEVERPALLRQIVDQKVQGEMRTAFEELRKQAQPRVLRLDPSQVLDTGTGELRPEEVGPPHPGQIVAYYHNIPVTREELGEYLVLRYGAENIDLLINHRLIEQACKERGIRVTREEIEADLTQYLKKMNVDEKAFEKNILSKRGQSLYEWREDVIRPRLLLTKLCRERVRASDEDVRLAFQAHHGERLECRMILWPPDQAKFAMNCYNQIRDSEEEFDRMARQQASPTLAPVGGKLPIFGRHTLGDENVEREAFRLQPGEVSTLVGTPQGTVVIKCDNRIPPDTSKKLEDIRPQLEQEVLAKKTQYEMQVVVTELRNKARPRTMLKDPNKPEDLTAEVVREMADSPEGKPGMKPLPTGIIPPTDVPDIGRELPPEEVQPR